MAFRHYETQRTNHLPLSETFGADKISPVDAIFSVITETKEPSVDEIKEEILLKLKGLYNNSFVDPDELAFVSYGVPGHRDAFTIPKHFYKAVNDLIKAGNIRYNKDRAIGLRTANVHKQGEISKIYQDRAIESKRRPASLRGH